MSNPYAELATLADEEEAPKKRISYAELAKLEDPEESDAIQEKPWWQREFSASNVGRQVGLVGRAVAQGVAALPMMAMDAGVGARNFINSMADPRQPIIYDEQTGSYIPDPNFNPEDRDRTQYEMPSQMWERGLNEYLPHPETAGEKVAGFVESTLAGSRIPAPQAAQQAPGAVMPRISASDPGLPARDMPVRVTDSPSANILREAQKAGYVIPPTTVKPNVINKVAEGYAGKLTTAQAASAKNQEITNELARKALGLGSETQITPSSLKELRTTAGKIYEQIADSGDIVPDAQFIDDLSKLGTSAKEISEAFPGANVGASNQIDSMVNSMLQDKFSSKAALQYLRELRKQASGNLSGLNAADPSKQALGMAQREAASTLEDLMERHLISNGKEDIAKSFGQARKLIAMSHSVEKALNESTGNVVAGKLGQQLAKGKPLSGELELAAKFSRAFPKASKEITESMPGMSPLDWATGTIATASSGNPLGMMGVLFRPGMRSALLSSWWQKSLSESPVPGPISQESIGIIPSAVLQGEEQ